MKLRILLPFHRWVALVFAPLLLLQALTGAALLFHEPLARLIGPTATSGSTDAPVSALVASARSAYPDMRVSRLFMPASEGDIAFAHLTSADGSERYAALDPGTAQVLAAGTIWRFPLEAALQIHYRLMTQWVGIAIVTASGIALAAISLSGLLHWWPGLARIAPALRVRRSLPARMKLRAWHRSAGAVAALLLLFSAITGILLAVPDLLPIPATSSTRPFPPVTLSASQMDAATTLARTTAQGASIRDIRFATNGVLAIDFFAPRAGVRAVDVVSVSARERRIVSHVPVEENEALWLTVLPLHAGDSLGLAGRLILLAEAVALIFLAISGPLSWWRSRRPRNTKPHNRSE